MKITLFSLLVSTLAFSTSTPLQLKKISPSSNGNYSLHFSKPTEEIDLIDDDGFATLSVLQILLLKHGATSETTFLRVPVIKAIQKVEASYSALAVKYEKEEPVVTKKLIAEKTKLTKLKELLTATQKDPFTEKEIETLGQWIEDNVSWHSYQAKSLAKSKTLQFETPLVGKESILAAAFSSGQPRYRPLPKSPNERPQIEANLKKLLH